MFTHMYSIVWKPCIYGLSRAHYYWGLYSIIPSSLSIEGDCTKGFTVRFCGTARNMLYPKGIQEVSLLPFPSDQLFPVFLSSVSLRCLPCFSPVSVPLPPHHLSSLSALICVCVSLPGSHTACQYWSYSSVRCVWLLSFSWSQCTHNGLLLNPYKECVGVNNKVAACLNIVSPPPPIFSGKLWHKSHV